MKTTKLCAWMLCSVLMMGTLAGCTNQQATKAVSQIAATMPAIESGVAAAAAIAQAVDPTYGPIIVASNAAIQAALPQLQTLLNSYASSPDPAVFASIVNVVDKLVADGDQALLAASRIVNPKSQQQATAIIASLDALLHVIDGFISQTQTPAQVKAKAAAREVKLQQVSALWSAADRGTVSAAMHAPFDVVYAKAVAVGF